MEENGHSINVKMNMEGERVKIVACGQEQWRNDWP